MLQEDVRKSQMHATERFTNQGDEKLDWVSQEENRWPKHRSEGFRIRA